MEKNHGGYVPKNYNIQIVQNVNDLEKLRDIWQKMNWHPNADIDFYITILNERQEILKPYIMVLYVNNSPEAMMIGRIEHRNLDFRIGYVTVYSPKIRLLTIIYAGLLGNLSTENSEIFVKELLDSLYVREFDAVYFGNLPVDSNIYQMSKTKPNLFCRDNIPTENIHWKAALTPTLDDFLKKISRKHRYWVRRMTKLLEKDFPGKVKIQYFTNEDSINQLCTDVESIASHTYQRGLGAGFVDNQENRARMTLSAKNNWLKAYVLYIEDKPCAFWIATHYNKSVHLNFTGYDSQYEKYEPGTVLFTKMVEDFCRDGIKEMDFGFGDAKYKSRFGDSNWKEASIYIFSPSLKSVVINLIRTLSSTISRFSYKLLEKTSLLEFIKKRWRKRLSDREDKESELES